MRGKFRFFYLDLYLLKLSWNFDETWYVIFSSNLVLYFGGFNSVGKFPRQIRGKFRFFYLGSYLLKLLSDFDETWYVIFSSNLVLYFGGLNSVGKFPRQGGKGK